jgi:hypothetical protein
VIVTDVVEAPAPLAASAATATSAATTSIPALLMLIWFSSRAELKMSCLPIAVTERTDTAAEVYRDLRKFKPRNFSRFEVD